METDIEMDTEDLSTAEEFLGYFQLDYDPELIKKKRIQLMRMFHHVLTSFSGPLKYADYRKALKVAYRQLEKGNELAFSASGCQNCSECDD